MFITSSRQTQCGDPTEDPIHLVTQFYVPADMQRYNEIKLALRMNAENCRIDTITLMNERIYTIDELGVYSPKIKQINIGRRLKFSDAFESRQHGYTVLVNSDIFLDDTISRVQCSDIHSRQAIFALLRYESGILFGPRPDSQDTWIIHSSAKLTRTDISAFRFNLGVPGCDNKVCYLFALLGFEIYNDPNFIKTHHLHASTERNYTKRMDPPFLNIYPAGMTCTVFGTSTDTISAILKTYDFNDCNDRLRTYISSTHFIVPRIAGIENNTAHAGAMKRNIPDTLRRVMKINAGIYLPTTESVATYAHAYLKAFHLCDMYASWEPWGNYHGHISDSQRFIQTNICKPEIGAFVFDIFHYLKNPWTHALRGKCILIVSPFVDEIRTQPLAYHTDLFPDCTFVYLKPPQTHGEEPSREWSIEFTDFCKSIDCLKFDVALCSCGGYGNPICAYIYTTGRSAIYVGGVLQMYFGLYGSRWIKERKEVLALNLDKHWKRPTLKPRGHAAIESSCYW